MLGLPPAGYGGFVPGVCSSNLCAAPARSLRRRHFAPLQCASPPPYQSCAPPCKPGQRCARRRRRRRRRRRQLRQVVPANRDVHWPLPHPATHRRRRRRHLPARGTTAASWRRRPSRRRKRRGAEDPVPAAAARVSRPRLPVVSRAGGRLASPRARAPVRDVDSGRRDRGGRDGVCMVRSAGAVSSRPLECCFGGTGVPPSREYFLGDWFHRATLQALLR